MWLFVGIILVFAIVAVGAWLLHAYTAFWFYHLRLGSVRRLQNLAYLDDSNPKHCLDVYLPKHAKDFPLAIFVHGGYWKSGDKNYRQGLSGLYANVGIALARAGIATAVINYRLLPEATIDGQLSDVVAAINYCQKQRANWQATEALVMMGHSAGGHLVSLLAASNDLRKKYGSSQGIDGCVGLSPVLDIQDMVADSSPEFNEQVSFAVFGYKTEQQVGYSPLNYLLRAAENSLPLLIMSGQNDLPYLQAKIPPAVRQVQSAGANIIYTQIPNYRHNDMVLKFGSKKDVLTPAIANFIRSCIA